MNAVFAGACCAFQLYCHHFSHIDGRDLLIRSSYAYLAVAFVVDRVDSLHVSTCSNHAKRKSFQAFILILNFFVVQQL